MASNPFAALDALDLEEGGSSSGSEEKEEPAAGAADAQPQPPPADTTATSAEGWLPASAPRRPLPAPPAPPAPIPKLKDPLIWLDLEMTGLDEKTDTILEISLLASDGSLKTTLEGPTIAASHPPVVLASMNAWSAATHARTGLTARCAASTTTMATAEDAAVAFVCGVMGWTEGPPGAAAEEEGEEGGGPAGATGAPATVTTTTPTRRPRLATLAGNSVHVDLAFLRAHMPRLAACCSHRVVDVSGIAELACRWFPAAFHSRPRVAPGGAHTAAEDVRASLEELRHYRATVFKEDNKEAGKAVAKRYPYGSQPKRGGRR